MLEFHQAIIALGTNIGDRRENLTRALALVRESAGVENVIPSAIYETPPVGVEDQPVFLNMVAGVETRLSPENLMELLLEIEHKMGRVRDVRWGPRLIDLDLLFYEREERRDSKLTLPHPRWAERSFVTVPLKDLLARSPFEAPGWNALRRRLQDLPDDSNIQKIAPDSEVKKASPLPRGGAPGGHRHKE